MNLLRRLKITSRTAAIVELAIVPAAFYSFGYTANLKNTYAHRPVFHVWDDASQIVFWPLIAYRKQVNEELDFTNGPLSDCGIYIPSPYISAQRTHFETDPQTDPPLGDEPVYDTPIHSEPADESSAPHAAP